MYDAQLLTDRMAALGLNWYTLSLRAKLNHRTVKSVLTTGCGRADSVYRVAKALKFRVTRNNLSVIVKRRTNA